MTQTAPEQRTAVMILVEVTWEDQSGTTQKTRACMVNRSTGGACIRVRQAIHVGAKLRVQWRWEQFTGTTRYCRTEGRDYFVGIQRDTDAKVSKEGVAERSLTARRGRLAEETRATEKSTTGQKGVLAKAVESRSAQLAPADLWAGVERRQGQAPGAQRMSPAEYLLQALEALEPEPPAAAGGKEIAVPQGT
jgi:hypothetical protein